MHQLSTAALAAALALAAAAHAAPAYKVTKTVALGAPDRWDYVVYDAPSHRAYVAHGDRVTVVDGHDGKVIGEVDGMPGGTHGIAISQATGQGFTDDGRAGEAVAFDLKTFAVKARIPVEKDADAMAFDSATGHVFVIEGDSKKVTAIDPATDKVVAVIDGGEGLEYAVPDGKGALFVAGAEKRDVVRINTGANTVEAHWPIADCASPHGAAIDVKAHRVFISCVNAKMVSVDTETGKEVATVEIGKGTDAAAFDPKRHLAFSSNGWDGSLSVIDATDADGLTPAATIPTAVSGRTMSIDPETGRIFILAADTDPPAVAGGRPRPRPGSLKLLFLDPVK